MCPFRHSKEHVRSLPDELAFRPFHALMEEKDGYFECMMHGTFTRLQLMQVLFSYGWRLRGIMRISGSWEEGEQSL
jgi:hypothetical protein